MSASVFTRKPLFTYAVKQIKPEFDAVYTNGNPGWNFKDTEGNLYTARCAKEFFEALNKRFGYFINPEKSTTRKHRWIVFFEDEPQDTTSKPEEDNPVKELPDWDYVDSIKDTKEGKLELDQYASKFGVTLKRNMKLENMVKDFKDQYED